MMFSRASPASDRCPDEVALFVVEPGLEQQAGHADHAVHRRADLVAHVRQELVLGARGVLGPSLGDRELGDGGAEFGGLRFEALLRALEVAGVALELRLGPYAGRDVLGQPEDVGDMALFVIDGA